MRIFKNIILFLFLNLIAVYSQSKVDNSLYITGYISFNGEYINNLKSIETLKSNVGVGIPESSLLATYKPKEEITLFSVFTFKPRQSLNSSLTEISGSYKFDDAFQVKLGRFILPIQPINLQYYAPMNIGIALPSFITNHKLFPLNMNGADIFGEYDLDDELKIQYNIIAGQYDKVEQSQDGVLGFFGREGVFMSDNLDDVNKRIKTADSLAYIEKPSFFGTGARVALDYQNDYSLGFGYFYGKEKLETINKLQELRKTDIDLFSYGADISLNYSDFLLKSSIWFGKENPKDTSVINVKDFSIFNMELGYTVEEITIPYIKFESINGMAKEDRMRTILGLNIRPIYDISFKAEYIRYFQDFIDDFDVFHFSIIYSF